jgi:hypothetical protein
MAGPPSERGGKLVPGLIVALDSFLQQISAKGSLGYYQLKLHKP